MMLDGAYTHWQDNNDNGDGQPAAEASEFAQQLVFGKCIQNWPRPDHLGYCSWDRHSQPYPEAPDCVPK